MLPEPFDYIFEFRRNLLLFRGQPMKRRPAFAEA